MAVKVWIDGKLYDKADAKISVYDHGLLYGDGVFEGIRVYHGKIFEVEAHLRRLFESARAIRLNIPLTAAQLTAVMEQTVKANEFTDCYIRLVVTRGAGPLGIDPYKCGQPSVICIADLIAVYPPEMYEKGISVITASIIRNHPSAVSPRIKSLNYLNNILARIEAHDAGVADAIMLNHHGNVAEATVQNIFIVRDGAVSTPAVTEGALEGVTRKVMLQICRKMGLTTHERAIERLDLYNADEMVLTGTGAELMPVTKVDGRVIGNGEAGPLTRKLIAAFKAHVKEAAGIR
jgi:branched-chain amino acid aminotransferase